MFTFLSASTAVSPLAIALDRFRCDARVLITSPDRIGRIDLSATRSPPRWPARRSPARAAKLAIESAGTSSTYLGKIGVAKVALILPTTKPIDAQHQRLLQDHGSDGAVARADQAWSTAISRILSIVSV